jgi:signal transduction histidine kinase
LGGLAAQSALVLAYGIAIAKYRLYDIDVVISKSVTYLGMAAVITVLYAAVVVVPIVVIGESDAGGPGLLLPIVATAAVAVLFEPIRSYMQRGANRLVYGKRATPHDVLSQVTANLSSVEAGDGSEDLARLVAEGTGAERAIVWLVADDLLQPEGTWSVARGSVAIEPVPTAGLVDDELRASSHVRHGEELLGAVSITKPRNDPITPADRELLADVAAGAGLLLRNISLNRQLRARADDVRESSRRLIAAQDAERLRLERDLHDGAQQQVVALKVKLGIARTVAEREGAEELATRVAALAEEAQQAVDQLRGVAHGIYPPLLEAEGLDVALRSVERSSPNGITIEAPGLTRLPRHVEETAYFVVLDTVERARMSGASSVQVDVADTSGELVIEIRHNGTASNIDLTSVTDRVDALGGQTTFDTSSGETTHITSRIPSGELAMEPA